jgi:hypothetical protein
VSTGYELKCETCGEEADTNQANRWGLAVLRECLELWPIVAPVMRRERLVTEIRIWSSATENPYEFLLKHDGHQVVIESEYGKVMPAEE